jgi:protein TonB
MRDPVLHAPWFSPSKPDSWCHRIRENLKQLFIPTGLAPSSANGAPIHPPKISRRRAGGKAQIISLITHLGVITAIALLAVESRTGKPISSAIIGIDNDHLIFTRPNHAITNNPSLGHNGGGGENNPAPATHGLLAPRSSIQLAQPRMPDNWNHQMPVPATILDEQAPPELRSESDLGLPWMRKDTNSAGAGKDDGFGTGSRGGMGDRDSQFGGQGSAGAYANGVSTPTCSYCPDPMYTDEARQAKVQGTVTLRVLVGADGKASDIRVVRSVGYGLEERAAQTVRGWKFRPARDASQRSVAAWVTIEAVFRLF